MTKHGIGATVGTQGMHYSAHSSGRHTASIGIPGTGLSYVSTTASGSHPTQAHHAVVAQPHRNAPGLFAPKGEKLLYKAFTTALDINHLEQIANNYPQYRMLALTMSGLTKPFMPETTEHSRQLLLEVFNARYEPQDDPFVQRYIKYSSMPIMLSPGVIVNMPISRELIGMVLSMMYQRDKNYDKGIGVLEQLNHYSFATTVNKAELNLLAKYNDEVLKLTDGISNEDDASMLALIYRAMALSRINYLDGALSSLKEALRFRSRASELRHMALYERAEILIHQGKKSAARKDLEKILAEDTAYPNVSDLLNKS